MIAAFAEGIGIGLGIVGGLALLFIVMVFTQDMGIWRHIPKESKNP